MQHASSLRPRAGTTTRRLPPVAEGPWVFGLAATGYLAAAAVLTFGYQAVVPEALSRVGNASYVLFSRDPHLAAIGFVWQPLQSFLALTLLPFKGVFPALLQLGFAGSVVSALFMAGSVFLVNRLLRDFGLSRLPRLLLTLLFGLHPVLLYVGGTGLPQALFLFFSLLATVALARWLERGRLSGLVAAGAALAAAYLASPAALGAVLGAAALVVYRSLRNQDRSDPNRGLTAVCDALILVGPVLLVVAAWNGATWLITGDPFHQLSSIYSLGSQLHAEGTDGVGVVDVFRRAVAIEPGLLALGGLAAFGALRLRQPGLVAGTTLLAPAVLTAMVAQASAAGLPSMTPFVAIIPLTVLWAAAASFRGAPLSQRLVAALALAVAIPASASALLDPGLAPQEAAILRPVVMASGSQQRPADPFAAARAIAQFLDAEHLPAGSVLVDSSTGFPVIVASANPRQFVITNDRDFRLALTDPSGMAVQYLLVPAPSNPISVPSLDALVRAYPGLYDSGAGVGSLVREFDGRDQVPAWRLFRVIGR